MNSLLISILILQPPLHHILIPHFDGRVFMRPKQAARVFVGNKGTGVVLYSLEFNSPSEITTDKVSYHKTLQVFP